MTTEHRMKTCGDCIHAELCEHDTGVPLFNPANEVYCRAFKDKDNFAEVIRCKDCKHCKPTFFNGLWWCNELEIGSLSDDDFCSHGERR